MINIICRFFLKKFIPSFPSSAPFNEFQNFTKKTQNESKKHNEMYYSI